MDGDALGPKESQGLAGVSCLTGALINFFLPSEKRNTLLLQNHVHIRETHVVQRGNEIGGVFRERRYRERRDANKDL